MSGTMAIRIGAVGFGHWFNRLYVGIEKTNGRIVLAKVLGVGGIENKIERMRAIGLGEEHYYRLEPRKPIPDEFFDGIDVVHISDPNEYHAEQTKQSLAKGKITITEKTWGVTKREFDDVVSYIEDNGMQKKAYLHLHYLKKTLTKNLPNMLDEYVPRYGKIKDVAATFFESVTADDIKRKGWLFSSQSGGLFMDWIHPYEIISAGAGASGMRLADVRLYIVNPDYDADNPTGIEARVALSGRNFSPGASAAIRVAKGAKTLKKAVRLNFESGAYLVLNYIGAEIEFTSKSRGSWQLFSSENKMIDSGEPTGPNASELLAADIIRLHSGEAVGIGISEAKRIYAPQWEYQEMAKERSLISDAAQVELFCDAALRLEA